MKNLFSPKMLAALMLLVGALSFTGYSQAEPSEAEMAAYMAAMTPGEQQAWLGKMAGTWSYTTKSWMDPKAPPMESSGTATSSMILGGRYLTEKAEGMMWEMPFEGISTVAYDNVSGKFQMTWIDNMGTGIMTGTGTRSGNVLTVNGTFPDPVTKKDTKVRMVTTVISDTQHKFEMYCTPAGKKEEMKTMEMMYTKK